MSSSKTYVPRSPRLPGLPSPAPDEFGDWDEYRDDLDPGYRVREVYENEHLRELEVGSQSTSITNLNTANIFDDELQQVSTSYQPSPVPLAVSALCMDENDELTGAASSIAPSHTPSLITDIIIPEGQHSSGRTRLESPTFGGLEDLVDTEMKLEDSRIKMSFTYDCHRQINQKIHDQDEEASAIIQPARQIERISLPVIFESPKTGFESSKEFDSSPNVIVAGRYKIIGFLGSAAFSKCVKAVDTQSCDREVCLKIIKNEKDFVDQSLDEIKILKVLNEKGGVNNNCLSMLDFFYWKEHLIIVTELLLDNLYEFSKFNRNPSNGQPPYFSIGRIQKIAKQVCEALSFIHSLNLIHCDLKPENILFQSYSQCAVKVIDFGSSCYVSDKLSSYVQSRCYRAPEVLLGCLPYDQRVDMWSLGCILAELWTGTVLFLNDSTQSLLARIIGIIGPLPPWMLSQGRNVPSMFLRDTQELFVELDAAGVVSGKGRLLQLLVPKETSLFQRMRIKDDAFLQFLSQLLQVDPAFRITAKEALSHPWLCEGKYPDGL
jgi:hypothetical protein